MSENEDKALENEKQESEKTNSESKKEVPIVESSGSWGKFTKKGNYITFEFDDVEGGIKGIDDEPVYPSFKYRKFGSREENGRKIIKLKLVGEQTVEFYEDELYNQFGMDIKNVKKKPRMVSHTDTAHNVYEKICVPILNNEKILKILQSKLENGADTDEVQKIVDEIQETIIMLSESK